MQLAWSHAARMHIQIRNVPEGGAEVTLAFPLGSPVVDPADAPDRKLASKKNGSSKRAAKKKRPTGERVRRPRR